MILGLNLTEGRHSGEADAVLDDLKQLLVGVALHLLAGEIGCTWVHPLAGRPLATAIVSMTYAAVQAVMCASVFNAGFCVQWARRNSVAACAVNNEALGRIADARFKTARLRQRRQVETHERDHNRNHSNNEDRPRDS